MMEMLPILRSENQFIGDWDLNKMDIVSVDIPASRVRGLITATQSSAGVLKKFNVRLKDDDLYIKSGSSTGKLFNIRQPVTERIASLIGRLIGLNVVEYKLWVIDRHLFEYIDNYNVPSRGNPESSDPPQIDHSTSFQKALALNDKVLVSVSKSFIPDESYTFISADQITNGVSNQQLHSFLCGMGSNIREGINNMLLFDYLTNNTDRHRKNFGFLQRENQELEFAPLYDHGLSMFSEFSNDEIAEEGIQLLDFCEGKPFGDLGPSFAKYFDKELGKHRVNLNVSQEDLLLIIDSFEVLLGKERTALIRSVIGKRWEYVRQKILSEI
ncbi:HipA domain-containing protein [Cohnella soli]|uniref:HipA domain-containing protein n=1 Tax=Cohnella soli TaxID=425005 RepID=A0ABW0HQS7_9BACL